MPQLKELLVVNSEPQGSYADMEGDRVVRVTYAVTLAAGEEIVPLADLIASHFYPGAGTTLAQESSGARERFGARVLGISEFSEGEIRNASGDLKRRYLVQIGIPLEGLGDSFATLLTATAGELLALGGIRLVDLQLPAAHLARFDGPKHGIAGIRGLLGVAERPLVMGIFRPCTGFSPQEGADLFFEAAVGGVDIVKDDELLTDPVYCQRAERVRLYAQAERRAYEETGEHTLYAVNITDRAERLLPNALEAIELGANALMVNYFQVGLDATRWLCENPSVTVPVLGHNAGTTCLYANPHTGVSRMLVDGRWPRLAGVDLCILLAAYGKFRLRKEDSLNLASEFRAPLGTIRPVLPIVAGGVSPALTETILHDFGKDVVIASGSGVFGHSGGARAGAKAFRQAIQRVLDHRDLAEAGRGFR